jgi:hypothetical protein
MTKFGEYHNTTLHQNLPNMIVRRGENGESMARRIKEEVYGTQFYQDRDSGGGKSYFQGYFDAYKHIEGENPYSPYTPDGYGLTISGSVDYNFTNYYASFSLVLDQNSKALGGFFTAGAGLSSSRIGAGVGASIDIHDTYGGSTLFDGLKGYSKGGAASFGDFGGTHYQSARMVNRQLTLNRYSGVLSNGISVNLKPSMGLNGGFSYTNQLF